MTHKEYSEYLSEALKTVYDSDSLFENTRIRIKSKPKEYPKPIPQYIKRSANRCIVKWADNSVTNVPAFSGESDYTAYCRALRYKSLHKTVDNIYKEKIGNATIVFWNDGTHTTVKLSDNDAYSDEEAYNAAFAKRIYGSNAALHRLVDTHTIEYINAQRQAKKAALRAQNEAAAKLAHIRKVKRVAKELRLYDEAVKYNESLSNNND